MGQINLGVRMRRIKLGFVTMAVTLAVAAVPVSSPALPRGRTGPARRRDRRRSVRLVDRLLLPGDVQPRCRLRVEWIRFGSNRVLIP